MKSVSIICTNYNKGDAVADAIESFLIQQTAFPVEILIVDDASTDGSQEIIRYYCENYSDRVTGIFKEQSEGIAKIWSDTCKIALGDYIAKCDAGDYWIDPLKLQKQLDLLESCPDSQWSNTDFDLAFSNGDIVRNAFAHKAVPFIDSFEDMLVTQGTTMASTWLVDAKLMRDANESVHGYAPDDMFSLQLELFKRTKLSHLSDSTTVYRPGLDSELPSVDFEESKKRIESIRDLQLEYIDSEEGLDYKELSKKLVRWHAHVRTQELKDELN